MYCTVCIYNTITCRVLTKNTPGFTYILIRFSPKKNPCAHITLTNTKKKKISRRRRIIIIIIIKFNFVSADFFFFFGLATFSPPPNDPNDSKWQLDGGYHLFCLVWNSEGPSVAPPENGPIID